MPLLSPQNSRCVCLALVPLALQTEARKNFLLSMVLKYKMSPVIHSCCILQEFGKKVQDLTLLLPQDGSETSSNQFFFGSIASRKKKFQYSRRSVPFNEAPCWPLGELEGNYGQGTGQEGTCKLMLLPAPAAREHPHPSNRGHVSRACASGSSKPW